MAALTPGSRPGLEKFWSLHGRTMFGRRTIHQSLFTAFRRFPQFDTISFGIGDPAELAVFVGLHLLVDIDALFAQGLQQRLEIIHTEVDHEAPVRRLEVLRAFREDRPDGEAGVCEMIGVTEHCACFRRALDAEVLAIPLVKSFGILRAEEDAADAGYALHKSSFVLGSVRVSIRWVPRFSQVPKAGPRRRWSTSSLKDASRSFV